MRIILKYHEVSLASTFVNFSNILGQGFFIYLMTKIINPGNMNIIDGEI